MTGKDALFLVAVSTFSIGLQALGVAIARGWF